MVERCLQTSVCVAVPSYLACFIVVLGVTQHLMTTILEVLGDREWNHPDFLRGQCYNPYFGLKVPHFGHGLEDTFKANLDHF